MTEFEKVADETRESNDYGTSNECAIEWIKGDKKAVVTFPCANRFNSKIRKLAASNPEDVVIKHENKDGSIVAVVPVKYIKISAPRIVTEEQKRVASERLKKMHNERSKKDGN